jgi:hypothetical protein
MTRYNKSEIMKNAWTKFRACSITFSEALKESWADAIFNALDFAMTDIPVNTKSDTPKNDYDKYYEAQVARQQSKNIVE